MKTFLFISALLFCITTNAQLAVQPNDSLAADVEPYDYDTILKGGYSIYFKVDDSLEYIYLKKGEKIITELSACSRGLSYRNLGYPGADFDHFFILVHSFGFGNPHHIELIRKSTGKTVIEESAAWIDVDKKKQMLLYCKEEIPRSKDRMILYNISTHEKEFFPFPKEIFEDPQVLNRIKLFSITEKKLVIEYEIEKGVKRKTYSR